MPNLASKLFHWLGGIWPAAQPGTVEIADLLAYSLVTADMAAASITVSDVGYGGTFSATSGTVEIADTHTATVVTSHAPAS